MSGIVLLSAGLDSSVALAKFIAQDKIDLALTFDYGQRAAAQEIKSAASLAEYYGIKHEVIRLPYLAKITSTSLVNRAEEVPALKAEELDSEKTALSAAKVWVPNRNGLFINIAASFAESLGSEFIITGFNAEEAATFPDNSSGFIDAINQSLAYSTLKGVKVVSSTQNLHKIEIVKLGYQLNIPWQHIWSCYQDAEVMCGSCESCQRLKRALTGVEDDYALKLLFKV